MALGDGSDPGEPLVGSTQAVVLEILLHGPLPRRAIADRLGLSGPTLTRITKPLVDTGVLLEGPALAAPSQGRPSIPLDLDADAHHFIGIKLTIDQLFVVVTDQRGVTLRQSEQRLVSTSVEDVVGQVAAVASGVTESDPRIRAIGVSLGALTVDRAHVGHAPFLGWTDVPLAELITAATGLPAWIENDVRALTQAEHWFGDGRGRESFALITVGAGIGLGIVANGSLISGAHSTAGSIGHQRLGWAARTSDAVCELGHHGCLRALLSEGAMLHAAHRALGRETSFDMLLQLASAGDAAARGVVDDAASALGFLVADVVNILDPDVVLLSGESVAIATVGEQSMHAAISAATHWSVAAPRVIVQPFRFTTWARGAAAVAIQMYTVAH